MGEENGSTLQQEGFCRCELKRLAPEVTHLTSLIWVHESNNGIFTHKRRKRVAHKSSISLHIIRVLDLHVPKTISKGCGN
jgi:hypothetical protein